MNSQVVSQVNMHGMYKTIIHSRHEKSKSKLVIVEKEYEFCPELWNIIKSYLLYDAEDENYKLLINSRRCWFNNYWKYKIMDEIKTGGRQYDYTKLTKCIRKMMKTHYEQKNIKKYYYKPCEVDILIKAFPLHKQEALELFKKARQGVLIQVKEEQERFKKAKEDGMTKNNWVLYNNIINYYTKNPNLNINIINKEYEIITALENN